MGPFLLLDKSTLQGLSFECLQFVSRYYQHIISPILLRELTSDLAKEEKGSSDAELKLIVTHLAAKTGSAQSHVLPDAHSMVCSELLGYSAIPMNGYQVPRENGIAVDVPGFGRGIFYDEHPMMQILRDWSEGSFSQEDLKKAKAIRDADSGIDLEILYQGIKTELTIPQFETLEDMIIWSDLIHFYTATTRQQILRIARHVFQDQPGPIGVVMNRWRKMNRPILGFFAPYAMYYYRVEIIHFLSLFCGFVSKSKKGKAHLDIQYLYYLPFCKIFSSNDKDLLKLVPFFLRIDQELVSKIDFQNDLKCLAQHFSKLSEQEAKTFYSENGFYPPDLDNSFTAKMWKKFARPRKPNEGEISKPSPEDDERVLKELKAIHEAVVNHNQIIKQD